jgi:hypothetical protein
LASVSGGSEISSIASMPSSIIRCTR